MQKYAFISLEYILSNGITMYYGTLCFIIWEAADCFPKWLHYFTFPIVVYEGFNFYTSSPTFLIFCLFYYSCSSSYEMVMRFSCAFPWWLNMLSRIFSCSYWPFVSIFGRNCLFLFFFYFELYLSFHYWVVIVFYIL